MIYFLDLFFCKECLVTPLFCPTGPHKQTASIQFATTEIYEERLKWVRKNLLFFVLDLFIELQTRYHCMNKLTICIPVYRKTRRKRAL